MLSTCIPALVIAGACSALMMAKMATRGQVAYAEAGNVVEQTVGAIRTVKKKKGFCLGFVSIFNQLFLKGILVTLLGTIIHWGQTSSGKV